MPNRPKAKEDDRKEDKKETANNLKDEKRQEQRLSSSSIRSTSHPERKWHKKDSHDPHDQSTEPLLLSTSSRNEDDAAHLDSIPEVDQEQQRQADKEKEQMDKEMADLEGMIEKKTYIGLVRLAFNGECLRLMQRFKPLLWR